MQIVKEANYPLALEKERRLIGKHALECGKIVIS